MDRVTAAEAAAQGILLDARSSGGWWEGELSSSALSTAVAVLALGSSQPGETDQRRMQQGLDWLASTQLPDGGWGDTKKSRANVATTLLVWSAFGMGATHGLKGGAGGGGENIAVSERPAADYASVVARTEAWLQREAGGLEPVKLQQALARRYGKDKTFAVPILMACAVGGRLGSPPDCWNCVPALPFELAAFPRRWFAALHLPVVSYALPALIAIGQVRHLQMPARRPWRWLRGAAIGRTQRLLREIQPAGGGFLEATPLTGFVVMARCAAGAGREPVVADGLQFLRQSMRLDGSWPIDTNLATWGTTLSVKALGPGLPVAGRAAILDWLLGQQYQKKHPYCLSPPGGWAWTDLPGGVPDADDTAGALLALAELDGEERLARNTAAAEAGARWLAGLQNRDGGMPTFCKGWGALPFDRSAPDLTAHALAAWQAWRGRMAFDPEPAMRRAIHWLGKTQGKDGTWLPLWFGNESEPDEANPVYGTATVLKYLTRLPEQDFAGSPLRLIKDRAAHYLINTARRPDGAWGGGCGAAVPSIEETAAALEALAAYSMPGGERCPSGMLEESLQALLELTHEGTLFPPAPIGLYFARLWYYEKLYPVIATVSTFRQMQQWLHRPGA